jgi:hypothetical protein
MMQSAVPPNAFVVSLTAMFLISRLSMKPVATP